MSRASKLFSNPVLMHPPTTVNREGYAAYELPIEEQYVQTLLNNMCGNTYYAKRDDLLTEGVAVHAAMLAKNPEFVAKALVYARNKGYMRLQTVYGLAQLSNTNSRLFKAVFDDVIKTPNDLSDFLTIRGTGGRAVKKAVANWLTKNMTEYWAIKYGSANKSKQGFSLKDAIRTSHPRVDSPLFAYLLNKPVALTGLPQVTAFEQLKAAETDDVRIKAIVDGQLPHEVVTPFASSKAIWNALVPNLPVFALLRNLATLERHGVLDNHKNSVVATLTDPKVIANSKILPFRFLEAEKHVSASWAKDALRGALELSFSNLPDITGSTAVFLDVSGSMDGAFLKMSAVFALALIRKTDSGKLLLFDTEVTEFPYSKRDTILTQASSIHIRGGTDTGKPFSTILRAREFYDNIILITDEQQNTGCSAISKFLAYRDRINPNTKLFIIDVSSYRSGVVDIKIPDVYYIFGWSDKVLDMISLTTRGYRSMVDVIDSTVLPAQL